MLDLLFVAIVALIAFGLGLRLLRALDTAPAHPLDAASLAIPLGLGLLALATLALGQFGGLDTPALTALLATAAAIGWLRRVPRPPLWAAASDTPQNQGRYSGPTEDRVPPVGFATSAFQRGKAPLHLLTLLASISTLLVALAPVTDGDALCYHLQVPKLWLAAGGPTFEPDLHETVYPALIETLYAVALAFAGPVACRLIQWTLGLCFAGLVTAVARPFLGDRASWAGLIALLTPAITNGMSAPLNDVALATYGTAALYAWTLHRDRPTLRRSLLLGAACGLAVGVKYPALVWSGLLGLTFFVPTWRTALRASGGRKPPVANKHADQPSIMARGQPSAPGATGRLCDQCPPQTQSYPPGCSHPCPPGATGRLCDQCSQPRSVPPGRFLPGTNLAAFAATLLLIGGCWYLRAYKDTGNPVFPFFRHTFGGAGLDVVLDPIKRPIDPTPINLLTALAPMTLEPDRFDSFSHQFGPAFLLFLPAILLSRPPRRLAAIVGLGYAFLLLCLTQRQSMRFLLIAVAPMSVGVAWLAARWIDQRRLAPRLLVAGLALVLLFQSALAAARARHAWPVALGLESRADYLARREPTYPVGRWIDAHLPADARLIGQDHRGFYIPRPYTMELAHRRRTGLGAKGESAATVLATLRARGFTHLLMCPPEPETAVEFDPTLGRLLADWLATSAPLYSKPITDPDGVTRRYAVYDLTDASRVARLNAATRR